MDCGTTFSSNQSNLQNYAPICTLGSQKKNWISVSAIDKSEHVYRCIYYAVRTYAKMFEWKINPCKEYVNNSPSMQSDMMVSVPTCKYTACTYVIIHF